MRERDVENYLIEETGKRGGEIRKAAWISYRGCPDRRILGKAWVEVKRPGKGLDPHQKREITLMRSLGETVYVVSCKDEVDAMLQEIFG